MRENREEHFHTEGGSLFIYDIIIQHIITSEVSTSKHISAESTHKKKILFFSSFFLPLDKLLISCFNLHARGHLLRVLFISKQ